MTSDIRLDEGDGTWVVVQGRVLKTEGSDLMLDAPERRAGHAGPHRRALVHDGGDRLTVNFAGDYTGGVTVNDARINLHTTAQVGDQLPAEGSIGDLVLLIRGAAGGVQAEIVPHISLWLCVPGSVVVLGGGGASWREVALGPAVRGTA